MVRPAVEKVLSELGIPLSSILINTGDPTVTKDEDIKNFNNLDVVGTEEAKSSLLFLSKKVVRDGTAVLCLVLLCLEVLNQKYLFCRLQCVV